MQRLEVSGAVRLIYRSLGFKGLITNGTCNIRYEAEMSGQGQYGFWFLR